MGIYAIQSETPFCFFVFTLLCTFCLKTLGMAAPWVKYNEVQLTFGSSVKQWNQLAVEAIEFASHIAPDLFSIFCLQEKFEKHL